MKSRFSFLSTDFQAALPWKTFRNKMLLSESIHLGRSRNMKSKERSCPEVSFLLTHFWFLFEGLPIARAGVDESS